MLNGLEVAEAVNGELIRGNADTVINSFCIDSREAGPGSFFIPLKGENTDGHLHIASAESSGAAGAFFSLGLADLPETGRDFLFIRVEDVLQALQRLAEFYRKRFFIPVVGITGSSGKTTTKDYLSGILSAKFNVLKNEGNLNNEIGLPLTVLQLRPEHQVAVLEMGMSAPGEILTLCRIAQPNMGIITNIGEAHIELLGSMEAITRAKGELLDYLSPAGIAVLNGDDPRLVKLGERYPGKVYYYSFNQGDIEGYELSQQGEKSFFRVRFPDGKDERFQSPLPGRESAGNVMAALTVAHVLGLSLEEMKKGLAVSTVTPGRLAITRSCSGVGIIDDTYNANPSSVKAALRVLAELGGRNSVAILGDMLELGDFAAGAHRDVGRFAADCRIGLMIAVGSRASDYAEGAKKGGLNCVVCESHAEAEKVILSLDLKEGSYVLLKGSRGMKMERLIPVLERINGGAV